ncbi:hypothetical protein GCM10028824_29800 [Hymenobacter segetis]
MVPVRPLDGVTNPAPTPVFSWGDLWDSTYQPTLENSLTEQLGFRPWLVRVRNQVAYSIWHKALADGVVLGKDLNLFQQNSIEAYLGRYYLGDEEIAKRAQQLRQVQDTLRAHGTELLFVIAPGKARVLPQYLPDDYASQWRGTSNYTTVSQQFAKYGINTLDAAALMLRWQAARPPYPLFTRTGTHWSGYATTRMADTLFHRIESMTGRDLPDFAQQGPPDVVTRAAELRYADKDLEDLLNLAQEIPPYPTAYPHVVFGPAQGKSPVNAIVIGDSFTKSFFTFYPYFDRLLAPESRFWYYNASVTWPEQIPSGETRQVKDLNLAQQLRGRQLVLILSMEGNLTDVGFGFINQAFNLYCTPAAQPKVP